MLLGSAACHDGRMPKRPQKPIEVDSEPEGSGIASAIAQDIELTAEQITDAARRAVVAVEKMAGLKPSSKRKVAKPRKATTKAIARKSPRTKPLKAKKTKGKTLKPKPKRK